MEKLQAANFKEYQFVSNPVFAPKTDDFVFQVASVEDGDNYFKKIWLCKDKGELALFSTGKQDVFRLWEDDRTILFSSDRDGKTPATSTDFYRLSIDGGEAEKAFTLPFSVDSIKKIEEGIYAVIASVDMDQTVFSNEEEKKDPWEADVQVIKELPFWENGDGFTANQRTRLFLFDEKKENGWTPISAKEVNVAEVRFQKETNKLYYIGRDFKRISGQENSLYQYDMSTGKTQIFLENTMEIRTFDFYKEEIILAGTDMKRYGLNENPQIFSFQVEGKKLKELAQPDCEIGSAVGTDSSLSSGEYFKIYKDALYFLAVVGYSGYLRKLSLETGEIEELTSKGDSVTGFTIAKSSGEQAVSMFHGGKLAEIFTKNPDEKEWKAKTTLNEVFHQAHQRSIPEHHVFTDAEGFEIDGWVMKPTNFEEGKKYPAILHVHGGPKTALGEIYHHEMQLWANNGYFVLYANPRGSDGKGDVFADIRGKYGTVDYEDLMQFVDEMEKIYPEMDPEHIGVTGGSYGGFMTNWIVGHTHRFKAAVTQRSITNWLSKTYMSDIGYYFNVDQVLAENWKESSFNAEGLWNSSPLKYAHTATTPLLVIHSDEDYRCPVPEGYQIFTALTLAGVDTKMCVFHGENHELSRSGKPKNRLRRLEEILSWMDNYLKN